MRAVFISELEPGLKLEIVNAYSRNLPIVKQVPQEFLQRLGCVIAFKVIPRAEEPLAPGLPLPLRERAQLIEPSCDGREKTLLPLEVRGYQEVMGGLLLIGPMRSPEALHGNVGSPSGLHQEMDALLLVLGVDIGVIAEPGPAGRREDKDALLPFLEGLSVCLCLGLASFLPNTLPVLVGHDALRSPGDLGNVLHAELVQDHFKRAIRNTDTAKLVEKPFPLGFGRPVNNGVPVGIHDGAAPDIAVGVLVLLILVDGEAPLDVLHELIAWREIQVLQ